MNLRWPAVADSDLVEFMRAFPRPDGFSPPDAGAFLARAELHGVLGVAVDALRGAGRALEPALEEKVALQVVARELDHAAHLEMLRRVDEQLARASIPAVVLKGALLAERLYPTPSARATTDIDLLVEERSLSAATEALTDIGFVPADGPTEDRFRREHHHLHFSHPHAAPLELHFAAYRGFGERLYGEPLIARRHRAPLASLRAIGILEPADELVYLAVHAAAHRFERLGWLFDLKLLVLRMAEREFELAARRAREWGYGRVFAFGMRLLRQTLDAGPWSPDAFRTLRGVRAPLARTMISATTPALVRSASSFVYTTLLCDSLAASMRYATSASRAHASRLFRTSA